MWEGLGSTGARDWIQSGRGRYAPGTRVEILEEGEILAGWSAWRNGSRSLEGKARSESLGQSYGESGEGM